MNVQIHKTKLTQSVLLSVVFILLIVVLFLFDKEEVNSSDSIQDSLNSIENEVPGSRSPKMIIDATVRRIKESFEYHEIKSPIDFISFFNLKKDDICFFSDFYLISLENNIYVGYARYTESLVKIDDFQNKSQYIGEAYLFAEKMIADTAENLDLSYFIDTTSTTCYFILADEAEKLSECYLSINESDFAG